MAPHGTSFLDGWLWFDGTWALNLWQSLAGHRTWATFILRRLLFRVGHRGIRQCTNHKLLTSSAKRTAQDSARRPFWREEYWLARSLFSARPFHELAIGKHLPTIICPRSFLGSVLPNWWCQSSRGGLPMPPPRIIIPIKAATNQQSSCPFRTTLSILFE